MIPCSPRSAARVREPGRPGARMDIEARARLVEVMQAEIARWCREPMAWGKDDCALAVANIIRAALGYDPALRWRGYHDPAGAARRLGRMGLGFALRAAARRHGWRRIAPQEALPGDVGLMLVNGSPVTVICRAPGWFFGRSQAGAALVPAVNRALPKRSIRLAWNILP